MSDATGQPKKNGHGGKRANAGRKPRAEKYEGPINRAEDFGSKRLLKNIQNLAVLADGGYERVIDRYEPAGLVFLDLPFLDPDGQPLRDGNGKVIIAKQRAYPHLPADQLVLVERKREIADKDRAANIWLSEIYLGKPVQQQEVTGKDGGPVETVAMTPEQWIARENERMTQAEQTLSLAPESDEEADA